LRKAQIEYALVQAQTLVSTDRLVTAADAAGALLRHARMLCCAEPFRGPQLCFPHPTVWLIRKDNIFPDLHGLLFRFDGRRVVRGP
jgi:hypothetical protein